MFIEMFNRFYPMVGYVEGNPRVWYSQAFGKAIIRSTAVGDKLMFSNRNIAIGKELAKHTPEQIITHLDTNWQKVSQMLMIWDEMYFRALKRLDDEAMQKEPFYMALKHSFGDAGSRKQDILKGIFFTFDLDKIVMEDDDIRAEWSWNFDDKIHLVIKEQGVQVHLGYSAQEFNAQTALNDYENRLRNNDLLGRIQRLFAEVNKLANGTAHFEAHSFWNGTGEFRTDCCVYGWGEKKLPSAEELYNEFKRYWK